MSVVKINALSVAEGQGAQLEERFSGRAHGMAAQLGFEGFQLLRPVAGETRYLVVSTWQSEDAYRAWREGESGRSHGGQQPPVATGSQLMEFEVVDL